MRQARRGGDRLHVEPRIPAGERADDDQAGKRDQYAGAVEQKTEQHMSSRARKKRPPGERRDRFTGADERPPDRRDGEQRKHRPSTIGKYPGPILALVPVANCDRSRSRDRQRQVDRAGPKVARIADAPSRAGRALSRSPDLLSQFSFAPEALTGSAQPSTCLRTKSENSGCDIF